MKKLMMLLAAVCVAGIVQGAFVNWKFGTDTSKNGYTVYAFDSANQATVLAALAAYDSNAQNTINGLVLSSATVKKGNANSSSVDVGDATSLMLLAINGAFEADKAFTYDTLDISGSIYTPPAAPPSAPATLSAFGNSGTVVAKGDTPPTPAIPEPTSGLLLLVGGAMLALRRKQK